MDIVSLALLTGFFGDATLQLLVHLGNDWGLKNYFKQHGSVESLFIAAGMMGFFYVLYKLTKLPLKLPYIVIYAILLDLLFRFMAEKLNLFQSLKGYYKSLNYFYSISWAIIPMLIPYFLYRYLKKV